MLLFVTGEFVAFPMVGVSVSSPAVSTVGNIEANMVGEFVTFDETVTGEKLAFGSCETNSVGSMVQFISITTGAGDAELVPPKSFGGAVVVR